MLRRVKMKRPRRSRLIICKSRGERTVQCMCVSPRDPSVGPISMYFGIVSKTVYGFVECICTCVSRRL